MRHKSLGTTVIYTKPSEKSLTKRRQEINMPYPCPYCSTVGTYRNNLKRHLMGSVRYGGHDLPEAQADASIDEIESGQRGAQLGHVPVFRLALPLWSEITREERFFTCMLFNDMMQDPEPPWRILRRDLGCTADVTITDLGFEVCFFRDAARADCIERHPCLEKQTFDLVLTLSSQSLVIIEAKAQQGFGTSQLEMLHKARKTMQSSVIWPMKRIYIVGLCSSKYNPRQSTRNYFNALLRWDQIANVYPRNEQIYHRADAIYGD